MKIVLLGLVLAGCQALHPGALTSERAQFYLESADASAETVTLPQSGVQISIGPKPVFTEYDITKVAIADIELGRCLVFQLTPAAARELQRITAGNPGRRLVLTLSGVPFGARRISQVLVHGVLFIFVEAADSSLPSLVASLNETCAALQAAPAQR